MSNQFGTIVSQSRTWQDWNDRLIVPILVVGGFVTVLWNSAILAFALKVGVAVANRLLS